MPLRFRSIVPYTLPGVLALIGWWWYISRKKERLISHDSKDGPPAAAALKRSSTEGSNGVVEKGMVSLINDTEIPAHRPVKVSNRGTGNEKNLHIHVHATEAAQSLEQSSEEATPDFRRVREAEVHKPSVLSTGKEDNIQGSLTDHKCAETLSPLVLVTELEKHLAKDAASAAVEVTVPCRSTKVTRSPPTAVHLSDAKRPEPEGEVSKYHSIIDTQDEMVVSSVTPTRMQRVIQPEAGYLETPSSVQLSQHILTSTPTALAQTSTVLTMVQNSITRCVTAEDIQINSSSEEEQDLEHVAAGLITEVISAATQEFLGVTNCQVTDGYHLSCSSNTALAGSRLCFQQEPITAAQKHHNLLKDSSVIAYESKEVIQKEEQLMHNGCYSAPVMEFHQKDHVQRGHWPSPSHQAVQSIPLLNVKLKGDGAAVLAEDSACSMCPSEDCISSEDFQSIMFDSQVDVIQVTHLSPKESTQPQSLFETTTEATVLVITEENSVDPVCETKRLNGIDLRNVAHGTSEVETDHSGGEILSFLFKEFV